MAKNISLLGADYPDVPAVILPKTGGGSAMFVDADEINDFEDAVAIVINGDTAPQEISKGKYLFIKNHSTLSTGGYHATANISSGGSVSGSNVSADADGIANSILEQIANIGKATVLVNNVRKNVTTSYASIGESFTITKKSLIVVSQSYSQQLPVSIGVKSNDSSGGASLIYAENASQEESVAGLSASGVLDAGTYYIWAKSKANTATGNVFVVTAIQIEM